MEHNKYPKIQVTSQDSEFSDFYQFAELLEKKLQVEFKDKIDDFDSIYWSFYYHDCLFVLSYDTFDGISIYARSSFNTTDEEARALNDLEKEIKIINSLRE